MEKSLVRSLVWSLFLSAILVSGSHAQDNVGCSNQCCKSQDQSEATVSLSEDTPDNPCGAFNVCGPKSRFEASASLLFLQPGSGNLVYSTLTTPAPFLSPHWNDQAVNPGFTPAFNVGMRYLDDSSGDIQLDWTHLNTYDNATAVAPSSTNPPGLTPALGPSFLIGPPPPFTSAAAVAHFAYDAVNCDAGLLFRAGKHVQMRTFAGVQGARISQSLSTNFQNPDGSISFTDVSKSVFTQGKRIKISLVFS